MAQVKRKRNDSGLTLLEVLIVMGISAVILAGLMSQYSASSKLAYDQSIKVSTNLQVQAILQTIGLELRVLGNGVPFDQANFQIGEDILSDPSVTEPIIVSAATEDSISFRLNETGYVYLLTTNFTPSSSLELSLTSVEGLEVNDPIYISNSVISGDEGFYGVISDVDEGTLSITIASGYVSSRREIDELVYEEATFGVGSILEEVPIITFSSPSSGTGITRDSGYGTVQMGEGSFMKLEYLDFNGNEITPPLTNTDIVNSIRSIRVTVSMLSAKELRDGGYYKGTATQTFGIRNLNYAF